MSVNGESRTSRRELLQRGGGLALGATALGSLLSACGDSAGTAGTATAVKPASLAELAKEIGRPVTYVVDAGVGPVYQPFMDRFSAEYAPLKAKLIPIATDVIATMQTQLAGGTDEFDVLPADAGYASKWSVAGWVRTLDELPGVAEQVKEMDPKVVAEMRNADGKLVSLPWDQLTEIFIYNAEHLEQIGAKPPSTWDEFLDQCRELKSKGVVSTPYSPFWNRDFSLIWYSFASAVISDGAGPLFGDDFAPDFASDPASERMLTRWKTALDEGLAPADSFTTAYGNTVNVFAGGKSTFTVRFGPQLVGFANPRTSRVADAVRNGLMPGPDHMTLRWGAGLAVAQNIPSPGAAAELLLFLGGKGRKGDYYVPFHAAIGQGSQTSYPAVNRSPAAMKEYAKWADPDLLVEQIEHTAGFGPAVGTTWFATFIEKVTPILQDSVRGKVSVKEGLKQAGALVDELRA